LNSIKHPVHGKVLANVAQESNVAEFPQPLVIVDDNRPIIAKLDIA
jgi:hypothetical protein